MGKIGVGTRCSYIYIKFRIINIHKQVIMITQNVNNFVSNIITIKVFPSAGSGVNNIQSIVETLNSVKHIVHILVNYV